MRVEWDMASDVEIAVASPGEEIGEHQAVEPHLWALVIGGAGGGALAVEGTPDELRAFAARVTAAAQTAPSQPEPIRE